MNNSWIQRSEKTLESLKESSNQKNQDRLDLVKSMRYAFSALGQSLAGWMQWVNSPEIMSTFSQEELQEMNDKIMDMVENFIKYDIEVTNEGMRKGFGKLREQGDQGSRFVI
jgi:hypothetical protein